MINEIIHGNSLEVLRQIQDNSVDLIVTDPPYDHKINGKGGCLGDKSKYTKEDGICDIIDGFDIEAYFREFDRVLKKFNAFIFCSNNQITDIMVEGEKRGYFTTLLVWYKTNAVPFANGVWKSNLEFIIHIRESGATFQGNSSLKSKIYTSPTEKSKYGHPTEKPLKLIENFIKIGSNKKDIILDPFLGSGTTVNACINLNRQYIGIEINKKYYEIAKNREQRALGNVGLFKEKV